MQWDGTSGFEQAYHSFPCSFWEWGHWCCSWSCLQSCKTVFLSSTRQTMFRLPWHQRVADSSSPMAYPYILTTRKPVQQRSSSNRRGIISISKVQNMRIANLSFPKPLMEERNLMCHVLNRQEHWYNSAVSSLNPCHSRCAFFVVGISYHRDDMGTSAL